ncbi:MAG: DUF2844 domain-containing protein [Caldimonas sp.]
MRDVVRPTLREIGAATLAAAVMLAAPPARAVLGGDVATIADDHARLQGTRHQAVALSGQVRSHEIALADGSSIREFVTPSGIVFAVAWSTRFKPNLEALLGQHAAGYAAAASEAMRAPGIRRHAELRRGDLVVQSTAHLNSYVGKAWLQSLVPEGVHVDALR